MPDPGALPGPEQAPGGTSDLYGVLTVAGVRVGLALGHLREVLPRPGSIAPLADAAPGLVGALALRGSAVTLVDVAPLFGSKRDTVADTVVIVGDAGRRVGILAKRLHGLVHVPASALIPVANSAGGLLRSCFTDEDGAGVVSLLDVPALLCLPDLVSVVEPTAVRTGPPGRAGTAGTGPSGAVRRCAVVRCGDHSLALEIAHVRTTLPPTRPAASVVADGTLCAGVRMFRGCEIPVLDPLALLGLGRLADRGAGPGLVVEAGKGHVALAVDALVDIVDVPVADVMTAPALAFRRHDLIDGIAALGARGDCLVLAGAALRADPAVAALGSLNAGPGSHGAADGQGTEGGTGDPAAPGAAHITYRAGRPLASPLSQITEVIPFPAALVDTRAGGSVLGAISHRGRSLPVVCLTTLLGGTVGADRAGTCLLVVDSPAGPVAFAVEALDAIDTLRWSERAQAAPAGGGDPDGPTGILRTAPPVRIGHDTRLLPQLDLCRLGAAVLAGTVADRAAVA